MSQFSLFSFAKIIYKGMRRWCVCAGFSTTFGSKLIFCELAAKIWEYCWWFTIELFPWVNLSWSALPYASLSLVSMDFRAFLWVCRRSSFSRICFSNGVGFSLKFELVINDKNERCARGSGVCVAIVVNGIRSVIWPTVCVIITENSYNFVNVFIIDMWNKWTHIHRADLCE